MKRIFALLMFITFSAGASTLRIASYNIKGLPFPIQLNHTSRYKKIVAEIRTMTKPGQGPDVLLIQEAFSITTRYLYNHLRDIYPYRVRGPANRLRWNSGLEILSRYPITDSWIITFGTCDSFDCLARKGVLHARIRLPSGDVDLYNTHMQADNKGRDDSISQRVRMNQTETMIKFVKNTHKESLPFFMGGDFNTRPDHPNYSRFLEEFGDIDTRRFCQISNVCLRFGEMPDVYWDEKIDHIFYGNAQPIDYQQFFKATDYSDHDMIMGTYQLNI